MRTTFAAALCAVALLSSCGKMTTTAVRVDPALSTLVPADTALLVGAKLDKLRETPIYQKHFSRLPLPRLDDFAKETGLDPRRDVWEILFASNGSQSGVLMARGKFTTSELEPKLEREGSTKTRYKGYNLFGDANNAAFFMNSSTALAGSTPVLKAIIDNRDRSGAGIPPVLQQQFSAIPAGSQFWAVFSGARMNLPFSSDSNLGNFNQFLRSVQSGRFSADLRSGLDLQASGACTTDQAARQIHDTLKGLIGLGRLNTPDNQPELLRVYDSIKVKQNGTILNLAANVPQDAVDKFLDAFTGGK